MEVMMLGEGIHIGQHHYVTFRPKKEITKVPAAKSGRQNQAKSAGLTALQLI
jgi:hypothetical protein